MARGKGGQVKSIKKNLGGTNANDLGILFNQLLGDEKSLDPEVVMDKFNKLKSNIDTIKKILQKFTETIILPKFSDNATIMMHLRDIKSFIELSKDIEMFDVNLGNVINVYKQVKDSELINKLLITCKNLLIHSKHIEDINSLSDSFIHSEPGISLELFSFSKLNFKTIFNSPHMNKDSKNYVLIVLSMLFTKSYDIYNLVTSPDIDIEKFSKIIIDSIQEARKSIPRCDKAFNKIKHSVDLLKNNFNNYYKDFIESQSPTIIIENFVIDVSKDLNTDAETTRQFKRIVMHYQKRFNESGKSKDPKLTQMFETINEKFKILETAEKVEESSVESDGEEEVEGKAYDIKE